MSRTVHCIGIGGAGVSAVAEVMMHRGWRVSGSDGTETPVTERLRSLGVIVAIGHREDNLAVDADRVVYSTAVPDSNVELRRAVNLGIPVQRYSQALGELMEGGRGIAVAGTHGKSTTAAMIAFVLVRSKRSPTYVIGAQTPQLGRGSAAGAGDLFVAEACEYNRTFLDLSPTVAVVTCIEEEHLDYFRDMADIRRAFADFVTRCRPEGVIVAAGDDADVAGVVRDAAARSVSFGFDASCAVRAEDPTVDAHGLYSFQLVMADCRTVPVRLQLPGLHNVRNALAAAAALAQVDVSAEEIGSGLAAFEGVSRRFEILGVWGGVTLVDDYAHHPTEVTATLRAARERFPGRRLVCAFQPHQHSRTRLLLEDLAQSLLEADRVVIPGIYRVRDTRRDAEAVRAEHLAERIRALGGSAEALTDLGALGQAVTRCTEPGDVLLTVGAGDIWRAHDDIKRGLDRR